MCPLFNTALHNRADKVLIWLQLTLLYTAIREKDVDGGRGKTGGGDGWMDGWIDWSV